MPDSPTAEDVPRTLSAEEIASLRASKRAVSDYAARVLPDRKPDEK